MRVHGSSITLSSAAPVLLGLISEPGTKRGNEKANSFLGCAGGPSGGDVGREEAVNKGINKCSERQRQSESKEREEQNERSLANKPASTALLLIAIKLKYTGYRH